MKNKHYIFKIIFFLIIIIVNNIYSIEKINLNEIISYTWSADFDTSLIAGENIVNIIFNFKENNNDVEMIENSKEGYSKYFYKYKFIDNELLVYYNDADKPEYVFKEENNKIGISCYSMMILRELKKINKNEIKILFYIPKIDSLRLRKEPNVNGEFIRLLKKEEKLELLVKLNKYKDTIDGKKGTWVKVKTEQGEVGWCFDAYLEEVKKK